MRIGVVTRKKQSKVISDKYDIEVEEHHNYFANGICVHNSVGMNVTDNVLYIDSIPTDINFKGDLVVRGEFYIPKSTFEKLISQGKIKGDVVNERNTCSGAIMSKNPRDTAAKGIRFFTYKAFVNGKEIDDIVNALNFINCITGSHFGQQAKFKYVEQICCGNPSDTKDIVKYLQSEREKADYRTDGIVVMVKNTSERESFGYVGKNPKGAIAFKFKGEQAKSRLLGVDWSTSKFGTINPVAVLSPVVLCDTVVKAATLHNISWMESMSISIGDDVIIEKAGDIIPYVARVIHNKASNNVNYPVLCPSCGNTTTRDGAQILCTNVNCTAVLSGTILNYLQALDIGEPGQVMVENMVKNGLVKRIEDLYKLDFTEVVKLPRCSEKLAARYIDNIKNVKNVPLIKFLCALPIYGVGMATWKSVCNVFTTLDAVMAADRDSLMAIPNIGLETANGIIVGMIKCARTIEALKRHIIIEPFVGATGKLKGKSFCITGTLTKPRRIFEELVNKNGGQIKSVTKDLDYLIAGDDAGSKLERANKLGIKVLSEEDFMEIIK